MQIPVGQPNGLLGSEKGGAHSEHGGAPIYQWGQRLGHPHGSVTERPPRLVRDISRRAGCRITSQPARRHRFPPHAPTLVSLYLTQAPRLIRQIDTRLESSRGNDLPRAPSHNHALLRDVSWAPSTCTHLPELLHLPFIALTSPSVLGRLVALFLSSTCRKRSPRDLFAVVMRTHLQAHAGRRLRSPLIMSDPK